MTKISNDLHNRIEAHIKGLKEENAKLHTELEEQKNERVHWQQRAWIAEDKVAKLQAEVVEKENAIYQYNVWSSADTVKIAKLQAEIERHKRLLYLEGWSDDRINRP